MFLALLMAALGVYSVAVSIQNLVSDRPGSKAAGWGVWVTAIGAVSTLLATIGLTVATTRTQRAVATVGQPAGWYPDPTPRACSATGTASQSDAAHQPRAREHVLERTGQVAAVRSRP